MRLPYEDTTVACEKSQAEICALLRKYGAEEAGVLENYAREGFMVHLCFPADPEDPLTLVPVQVPISYGKYLERLQERHPHSDPEKLKNKARRVAGRAAYYYFKATLEMTAYLFISIPQAFLAGYLSPGGVTVGNQVLPRLREWAEEGRLGLLGNGKE